MKKICLIAMTVFIFASVTVFAGVKEIKKADKNFDFKSVDAIIVAPVTSDNVDFGKVDPDRMPKIKSLLEKTKKNLRESMIEGSKGAKTTIPFSANVPKKAKKPLLLKYNIDQFDNGNALARMVPMAGKAKVKLTVQFINPKDKSELAIVSASAKATGGVVAGGLDSEVLWTGINMANADVYKYLKKLTGLDYSFVSGVVHGVKPGVKRSVDEIKEEKKEADIAKKKAKQSN